jgi:hypothetical protein
VVMLPPQRHEILSSYYRAADVCVVPSHSESFGLVALEAAACGVPVVAGAVGGLTTLIDDARTGFLVEGRDPATWLVVWAGPPRPGLGPIRGLRRPTSYGPEAMPSRLQPSWPAAKRSCPSNLLLRRGCAGRVAFAVSPRAFTGSCSFGEVRTVARARCSGGGALGIGPALSALWPPRAYGLAPWPWHVH